MCTLMALTLAGTLASAGGAIMQGNQANAAAQAQAQAQEQQAEAERRSSAYEMSQERRKQDLAMSSARAQVGASGVSFAGSPTEVLKANAAQGELDIQAILYGSLLRQNTMMTQAGLTRMEGRQRRTAGFIDAASSVIGGAQDALKARPVKPRPAVRMGQNVFASGGLY